MQLGLISDTHGLMRPEALVALAGSDHILHAGDVGSPAVLEALRELAPLTVVRGNVDAPAVLRRKKRDHAWAEELPESIEIDLEGRRIHLLHDVSALDLDGSADVVVFGHSHRPEITWREGVLFINPGSAGPRRFSLPTAVATLDLDALDAQIVTLL